jgi:hypothetical protein
MKNKNVGNPMKNFVITSLSLLTLLTGCATNAGTGVIGGGALGAGIGGISGGGGGALISGAAGLIAGSLIGYALDEQDRKVMQQTSPRTVDRMDRDEPLTINDVIKLSQGGVSDEAIIHYIQTQKTNYNLTQAQVRRMQDAGVSQRVINAMINTGK